MHFRPSPISFHHLHIQTPTGYRNYSTEQQMDSSDYFDVLKAKKLKAMESHRRNQKLKTLLHVSELCIALLLLSRYSTGVSAAVRLVGVFFREAVHLLTRPLSVFLLSNAIIAAVAVLSGKKDGGDRNAAGDLYDEYVSHRKITTEKGHYPSSPPLLPAVASPEDDPPVEKQIILSEVSSRIDRDDEAVIELTDSDEAVIELMELAVTPSVSHSVTEDSLPLVHQERTLTELEIYRKPNGEPFQLLGSHDGGRSGGSEFLTKTEIESEIETETETEIVTKESVEDLSNEEFNMKVEKYIATTRRFQQQERVEDMIVNKSCNYKGIEYYDRSVIVGN